MGGGGGRSGGEEKNHSFTGDQTPIIQYSEPAMYISSLLNELLPKSLALLFCTLLKFQIKMALLWENSTGGSGFSNTSLLSP
jgi:hypothetical protein